jgi:uncharacterized membrane protein
VETNKPVLEYVSIKANLYPGRGVLKATLISTIVTLCIGSGAVVATAAARPPFDPFELLAAGLLFLTWLIGFVALILGIISLFFCRRYLASLLIMLDVCGVATSTWACSALYHPWGGPG